MILGRGCVVILVFHLFFNEMGSFPSQIYEANLLWKWSVWRDVIKEKETSQQGRVGVNSKYIDDTSDDREVVNVRKENQEEFGQHSNPGVNYSKVHTLAHPCYTEEEY